MNNLQRYNGAVAVWYSTHYQIDTRDWDNIQEFGNPHHPLLGYYKSDDPEVVRQHLKWMRRAGIDLIIYDVFSTGKWDLTDIEKDRALPILLNELENQEEGPGQIKIAIWLEKYLENPAVEQYEYALGWVRENIAEKDYYFRYEGKPLVVTYLNGENRAIDEVEWRNDYFALRRIRPYYTDVWCYIEPHPQQIRKGWMSAAPGYNDYLENAYVARHVQGNAEANLDAIRERASKADREDGEYFRRQLRHAIAHDPAIIFVSGWNDWQYANQIEPAEEYRFQYVDILAEETGRANETGAYRDE